ncbi:MAG: isocitrate/isopropylmalate family dehydrogenase [Vicinamibacterales bacterium]
MSNTPSLTPPSDGAAITRQHGRLVVPDNPIIPFIEGDGTGPDIWRASVRVLDAAVAKAYGGAKKIAWMEVYAGEKSFTQFNNWLPNETVEAFSKYLVGIKGPLTTPVGGGIRSLNVALRQLLDLYVCLRPVRWYKGVPSPVKNPGKVDMVIFRENTEDIYAGIEYAAGTPEAQKILDFFAKEFPKEFEIRFGTQKASEEWQTQLEGIGAPKRDVSIGVGVGIKPIQLPRHRAPRAQRHQLRDCEQAQERHARAQGEHHEVHRGRLPRLGLSRSRRSSSGRSGSTAARGAGSPTASRAPASSSRTRLPTSRCSRCSTRPDEFDVIATPNLNGDYLSDALAAQVGGIGIAPGGNINYVTGHAIFEATHGTAPKYANLDKVNPGSVILSGEMMLRHMGWNEAADLVVKGMDGAIESKRVTYDFARLMDGATELKCSEFGDEIIRNM